jgi:peptidoglycan biosynthesis protein MviN/MurJ (putative lipid II flippase)
MGKPGWETTFAVLTLVLAMLSKPIFIAVAGPVGAVAASAASWGIAAAFLLFAVHRKLRLLMAIVWRNVAMFALTVLFATIGWAVASTYEAPAGRVEAAMILLPLVSLLALAYLSIMRILGLVRVADLPSLRSPLARPPRRVR